VNGRKIVLSVEDDACDPKQAVSVANHVIGEQISLVDATSARALQFRLPQSTPSIACS